MKKLVICFICAVLILSGCAKTAPVTDETTTDSAAEATADGIAITFSDEKILVDGNEISSDSTEDVYFANDIVYYPEGKDFTFGEGTGDDEHAADEAEKHTVVHIGKPGCYILRGKLSFGQVAVDLGDGAKENPEAKVTLILNGVDITCTVAPAVIFYNVYECGSDDEDTAVMDVDTKNAGADVIIADGTENNINGSYVAKIYKSYELNDAGTQVVDSKKLHKYDGAFYSKRTMNISGGKKGDGILNINAENEGLDSELHLTINGGIININSGNDGINTNEDNVSVTTVNGGTLNILCNGKTGEGDGIDSNGWLVINGGTVNSQACSTSGDAGIDSDKGIYINGGSVMATGNMLDHIAGGDSTYVVFAFRNRQNGGAVYTLKNADGEIAGEYATENAFAYLIIAGENLKEGDYTLWQANTQLTAVKAEGNKGGMLQGMRPDMPMGEMPEDFTVPEGNFRPEMPEDFSRPGNMNGERPQMNDGGMPEGFNPPDIQGGATPEMPGDMTPPDVMGGMPGGIFSDGENSAILKITKGGNQFSDVAPLAD